MQNNVTQIKCIVNGKELILTCPVDTNTAEAKEGCFQFLKYIGKVEDLQAEQMKQEQETKVDVPEDVNAEIIHETIEE